MPDAAAVAPAPDVEGCREEARADRAYWDDLYDPDPDPDDD